MRGDDVKRRTIEHTSLGDRVGEPLGTPPLIVAAPQQRDFKSFTAQPAAKIGPVALAPLLRLPRRAVQQQRLPHAARRRSALQAVVDGLVKLIAKRRGTEHAIARDRMQVTRNLVLHIVEARRQRLLYAG